MNYKRPIFIAELCCNHMGSVDLAKLMIDLAKKSGVDIVKFQKRDIHVNVNLFCRFSVKNFVGFW